MTKVVLDLQYGIPFNLYEDELLGAVILSLYCDARGVESDGSVGRGWWADGLTERDRWGSRLWELIRSKDIPETLRIAEDYAKAALSWIVDDGVASNVSVMAYSPKRTVLGLLVKIDNHSINLEVANALRP
ncbi:phage GP46 family protein [Snodgrassella alvi]|uniref:phage GP46 family protein n=1 Tax=Snodgrassella alvi TaxID=1196083 RepID=UPI0034611D4A